MPRKKSAATLRRERLAASVERLTALYDHGALYSVDPAAFFDRISDELEARRAGQDPERRRVLMERLSALSCGDNSCFVGRARGMCTNGGCNCFPRSPPWMHPWPPQLQQKIFEALMCWRELAVRQELAPTKKDPDHDR